MGADAWRGPGKPIRGRMLPSLLALLAGPLAAAPAVDVDQLVKTECASCHTQSGNSLAPPFPKLAGLAADYTAKQFRDVQSGARQSDIMAPIAGKLSRAEINALADYFSRQARTPGILTYPELVPEGEVIFREGNKEKGVPACAGCHTKNGAGAPRFPMIASQNADYVVQQLRNFRSGARSNDFGKLMRTTVGRLSDEEILAVAQYVASLPAPPVGR